jgi:hypothetical protein
VSSDEVVEALRQAGTVWERAMGRPLFAYDDRAPLKVTLVYDDRQQATQGRQRLKGSMQELQASHESVGRSFTDWRERYERRALNYQKRYADYRNAPPPSMHGCGNQRARRSVRDVQTSLEAERSQLDAMRVSRDRPH